MSLNQMIYRAFYLRNCGLMSNSCMTCVSHLLRLTTRWRRPGMRRDLHVMERICYIREQELGKAQAPQLEAVRWIF
jgi:hypothetical protein